MTGDKLGEVLFEYVQMGNSVRVTAIDADSGLEVMVQVPARLSGPDLQRVALQKLRYMLAKKRDKG